MKRRKGKQEEKKRQVLEENEMKKGAEGRHRYLQILKRPIPTHLIVNESEECNSLSLSTIQSLIDRKTKLLSKDVSGPKRKLSFVVLSTSDLASTIRLSPPKDTDAPTVTVRPFSTQNSNNKNCVPNNELVHQMIKIFNDQVNRKLNRNIHGIFIHWGDLKQGAPALRAMLQCFFLDDTPGITRLDLQGVVTIVRPSDVFSLDNHLAALTDRFVLAVRPKVIGAIRSTSEKVKQQHDQESGVTESINIIKSKNPRSEIVQSEIGLNNLSILSPKATEEIDEIFAYSRVVVTQIFPRDNDKIKLKSRLNINDLASSMTLGIRIVLPNHKSVSLNQFYAWMEQLLSNDENGDIVRIKGLMAVQGSRSKYIVQGVGKSFGIEASHEEFWNQSRRCTLFLVGKNLDGEKLRNELLQCIPPENCLESYYWWADAHCYVILLAITLLGIITSMVIMSLIDFGFIEIDNIVLPF
jgi:G3E family GTPase